MRFLARDKADVGQLDTRARFNTAREKDLIECMRLEGMEKNEQEKICPKLKEIRKSRLCAEVEISLATSSQNSGQMTCIDDIHEIGSAIRECAQQEIELVRLFELTGKTLWEQEISCPILKKLRERHFRLVSLLSSHC